MIAAGQRRIASSSLVVLDMELKNPAKAAREGTTPFTKKCCVLKAMPASETVRESVPNEDASLKTCTQMSWKRKMVVFYLLWSLLN